MTNADEMSRERMSKEVAAGGTFAEAGIGLAAVVLAILGISGTMPLQLGALASILVGVALILESGAIATRYYRWHERTGRNPPEDVAGGLGLESFAGVGAVLLGVLSLFRISPYLLLPSSMIVLGVGLLFGTVAASRVNTLAIGGRETADNVGRVTHEAVHVASGAHVLIGLGAIVLGTLGLVGPDTLVLSLVSALILGSAVVVSGAAIGGKLVHAMHP